MTTSNDNKYVSHIQERMADESIPSLSRVVLRQIEGVEQKVGNPFQCWDKNEFQQLISVLVSSNNSYNSKKISVIRAYLEFLGTNGYMTMKEVANHPFSSFTSGRKVHYTEMEVDVDIMKSRYFFSTQEFKDFVEAMCPGDCYCMRRAVMGMAWLGMSREEINAVLNTELHKPDETSPLPYIEIKELDGLHRFVIQDKDILRWIESAKYSDQEFQIYVRSVSGVRGVAYAEDDSDYIIRARNNRIPNPAVSDFDANIPNRRLRCEVVFKLGSFIKKRCAALPDDNPFKTKSDISIVSLNYSGRFVALYESGQSVKRIAQHCYDDAVFNHWVDVKNAMEAK